MTFGVPTLLDGIEVTTLAVGLFAMGETLYVASRVTGERGEDRGGARLAVDDADDWKRGRGSPGCAAPPSASRSARCRPAAPRCRRCCPTRPSRRLAKHPEEFGNGAIEGVAGPEAANNAAAAGTLVPLLTLGLPTSATAAMMLAAFQQYGLQPGPLLFVSTPNWSGA